MFSNYKITYENLISIINERLKENGNTAISVEERYSNIESGVIEKLKEYYDSKGYDFDWLEEDDLLVVLITPK